VNMWPSHMDGVMILFFAIFVICAPQDKLAHFNHNLVVGNQSEKGALPLWNISLEVP